MIIKVKCKCVNQAHTALICLVLIEVEAEIIHPGDDWNFEGQIWFARVLGSVQSNHSHLPLSVYKILVNTGQCI